MIVNSSLSGNSALVKGGGIYNIYCNPTLINAIVWGNSAVSGGAEKCGLEPLVDEDVPLARCIEREERQGHGVGQRPQHHGAQ